MKGVCRFTTWMSTVSKETLILLTWMSFFGGGVTVIEWGHLWVRFTRFLFELEIRKLRSLSSFYAHGPRAEQLIKELHDEYELCIREAETSDATALIAF